MALPDRVKETTTTVGTGNITLLGAVAQFQPLSTAFTAAQSGITLCIADQSGTNWEVSSCTYINATTISRDIVLSSSNAGALVSFAAGTKDVFYTLGAADIAKLAGALAASVTSLVNNATSTILVVESSVPKQITVANMLIAMGALTASSTNTLTSKRITSRVSSLGSSATPTCNTDSFDRISITGLAINISSMSSGLTGTPVIGDTLTIDMLDNGTPRSILWGTSFEASTIGLPTQTIGGQKLSIYLDWNPSSSKWRCVGYV